MSKYGFLYDDNVIEGINKMSFSTNILEKYDNVTYHCALFAFNKNTQDEIDKTYVDKRGLPEKFYMDKHRVYIARDGVTTKFSINRILMKNVFGNINSPMNIGTFEIKLNLVETNSCIFTNELEALAYYTGYEGYMYRPYWFEVWFSGFKHDTLEPIDKIPLPNGSDSIVYKGCFGNVKSHLEATGTTWNIDFIPTTMSVLNKNTNILSVPEFAKNDTPVDIKEYMQSCADYMFNRFLNQICKNDEEKNAVIRIYNDAQSKSNTQANTQTKGVGFLTIRYKDLSGNNGTTEINSNYTDVKISSDSSGDKSTAKDAYNKNESGEMYFTTACQRFLNESADTKWKGYIAKYDIDSELIKYFNNVPLYHHTITVYLEKDPFMVEYIKNENYDRYELFRRCRNNNSLIKKYQYGYSGADTSVIEVFNNYDMLYFMNALPQTSQENIDNNTLFINERKEITKEEFKEKHESIYGGSLYSGNLEDIYKYELYNKMKKDDTFFIASSFHLVPELNQDTSNNINPATVNPNYEKEKENLITKLVWERLFKSGQMSTTKFTILGDPYWIATQCYKKLSAERVEDDEKIVDNMKGLLGVNIPDYRCVFTIRSTPDQNDFYSDKNPTDYTFEYSMNASGIYLMIDCESIFEDGKFTQKLNGVLDTHMIKREIVRNSAKDSNGEK